MNELLYKKKLIEKKYKEKYSLDRDNVYFQKYYEIKTSVKYGQSKFYAKSEEIKNLINGSYVEGPGLFQGVTIQKLEQNYFYLSRPVLSYGIVSFSFKCKLSLGDNWLDWSNESWKEKINNAKSEFKLNEYKNQDSYFLRVKNHYESRCLYPAESYYLREAETPEVFEYVYCGNSVVNTSNIEEVYCGENAKYMGELSCNNTYSQINISDELYCEDMQIFVGKKECGE